MPLADLPQSNKQHPVPQNIMDVEFKLVGDLTMRQFSYLLACGVLAYLSFATVIGIFKIILIPTFIILGLALAFFPVSERGLDEWIAYFLRAINMPTQRVWRKEPTIPVAFSYQSIDVMKQELITLAPTSSRRKLEEYLKYQNREEVVDPLDIPEKAYMTKVHEAFAYLNDQPGTFVNAPTAGPQVMVDEEPEKLPETFPLPESAEPEIVSGEQPEAAVEEKPNEIEKTAEESVKETKEQGEKPVVETDIKVERKPVPLLQTGSIFPSGEIRLAPITPDMRSGRMFTNLAPSNGELILPIRGERVLKTSNELDIEQDIKERAEKLNKLLAYVKESEGIKVSPHIASTSKPEIEVSKEAQDVVKSLKEQNDKLSSEIERLKSDIASNKSASQETSAQESALKGLEEQKEKIASSYSELGKKYQELEQKLEEKKQSSIASGVSNLTSYTPRIQPLTQSPDVVTGFVKDSGGKAISNVLLLIKNKKGEPVRAFKSNSLGQFMLLTPLDRGIYTLEVSPNNNLSDSFDIIPIEVKGDILPPIELTGK